MPDDAANELSPASCARRAKHLIVFSDYLKLRYFQRSRGWTSFGKSEGGAMKARRLIPFLGLPVAGCVTAQEVPLAPNAVQN